jgi:rhamnogalacturonyl hydrolase YesR
MMEHRDTLTEAMAAGRRLLAYCRANDWAGYDPYDALNSELFKAFPVLNRRIPRLVLTQSLKRSPVNIRPYLRIPKTQNPKGLALFLSALLKAPQLNQDTNTDLVESLAQSILSLRSSGTSYWAWGYSFPWQTRTIVVPRGYPNLVCTMFVAGALLDLYEYRHDPQYLKIAVSAAEYMVRELYWESGDGRIASFDYPLPAQKSQTHNANLLAAAFLCRVFAHTGDNQLLDVALKAARYSAGRQQPNGAWYYGEAKTQQWIDNFHTGYNLCALQVIARLAPTPEFDRNIERGLEFYTRHFFLSDGTAKYFHDRTYPIDIHCVAQSIITLMSFKTARPDHVELANRVFQWARTNMWDDNNGCFYYRVLRLGKIRTSYMRWSQAWMVLALATLVSEAGAADTSQSHIAAQA